MAEADWLAEGFEQLESVQAWHIQVEQQNVREGIGYAIGKSILAFQIGQSVESILYSFQMTGDLSFFEGLLKKKQVVCIVLRDKDVEGTVHELGKAR